MIIKYPNLKNKISKCNVCGSNIKISEYGNGDACPNCGWRLSEESFQHPDIAGKRNIPSLNNAQKQFKEGKSAVLSNFDDFIEAYKHYGEVEFTYRNNRYGILYNDFEKCDMLLNINTHEEQLYQSIDDLAEKANIDGILLKDLWKDVTNTDFLQEFN